MSVIHQIDYEFALDHGKFIMETYNQCCHQPDIAIGKDWTRQNIGYKRGYFQTTVSHTESNTGQVSTKTERGKKRKLPPNDGEIESDAYHESVKSRLQNVAIDFRSTIIGSATLNTAFPSELLCFECKACSKLHQDLCRNFVTRDDEILIGEKTAMHLDMDHLHNKLVTYNGNVARTVCLTNELYTIPANSSFLLSDIKKIEPLLKKSTIIGGFDIIVIDPPWENKSVKRGKKYSWLSLDDITKIPFKKLMNDDCLIFVWVTNKQKFHKFVVNDLFPKIGAALISEWHWVKMTGNGDPLFSFESTHKRPYETILVGKVNAQKNVDVQPTVLCSIPCSVHSHKPSLVNVLKKLKLTDENSKCLELFARNLTPGWTSWGNEVLFMQNLKHFQLIS